MSTKHDDPWRKKMETRINDVEKLSSLLKDEMSGLRISVTGLLAADREKSNALEGHHQAYAAASLRAEYAETRANRAEKHIETLEAELNAHRHKTGAA